MLYTKNPLDKKLIRCQEHIQKKDRLLASIYKISQLANMPITRDKILTALVKEMKKVFGLQRCLIFLINKRENTLEVRYLIGFSPQEVRRAFKYPLDMDKNKCRETLVAKTGKTIYIRNSQNSSVITQFDFLMDRIWKRKSSVSMPLKIKGEIIGVIQGDQTERELVLSKEDINLFSTFASHAGIIIENARLQEQYQKKITQLLSLQEITKKTSSTLNLGKLLNFVTVNAKKITGASICWLMLVERDHLRIVACVGHEGVDKERFKLRIGEGIAGWVAEKRVPLLVADVHEEPRYYEYVPGICSKLAVPLVSENKIIGVLVVDSYKHSAFSLDDLEILMVFSSHTAVVLDSVRLYEQVISERNFAANILESSPNGIITIDTNKKIRAFNRKAEEILGIKSRNALNKKIADVFESPEVLELLNDTMDGHRIIENRELAVNHKDGATLILGFSSSPLKTDETRLGAMIITIQDMTEIKNTEALIRQVDRLSSLGQLSAGIAHEIRNPLACINFNTQLLSKSLLADKKAENIFRDTFEGIDRIKKLVKRILDFTKTGSPSLKPGSIYDAVLESLALLEPQIKNKNLNIKKTFCDNVPEVVFDPHQIQQVFVNLLMNAAEAMDKYGTIEIKGAVCKNHGEDQTVVISIADQGMGIPKESIPKIFDPFFTTKPDGTGLGLSIVYKILEQHGTRIDVKSKEGKGTTFNLYFPIK